MGYNKRTWKDEVVEFARRYKLKNISTGAVVAEYDLERVTGVVVDQDAVNASKLNNMENGIESAILGTGDYYATSGTSTNYTVTTGTSMTSIPTGFKITIQPHADSTGSPTLNVDGNGAINCVSQEGEPLVFKTGVPQSLRFNGTNFIQPSSGGLGTFFGDGSDGTISVLSDVTTAPNGGTVANLWDMNAGTVFTTNTLSSASDQVVFQIDFGKPTLLVRNEEIRQVLFSASISTGANRTLTIQYSNDGTTWIDTNQTMFVSTTGGNYFPNVNFSVSARYWRYVLKAGGSTCTFSCQGCIINVIYNPLESQTTKVWRILEPSTLNGGAVIKQYTSYNLPVGYEHTVQNPNQGLIIYSQTDAVVNGILDMSQKAGLAPNGNVIPMIISKTRYEKSYTFNTPLSTTKSLLHFLEPINSTTFSDVTGKVWTTTGNPKIVSVEETRGVNRAVYFNGSSYISTPDSTDFNFGANPFTIEFYLNVPSGTTSMYLFGKTASTSAIATNSFYGWINGSGKFEAYFFIGTSSVFLQSVNPVNDGREHHIAVVRNASNQGFVYVDGQFTSSYYSFSGTVNTSTHSFVVGRGGNIASNPFVGNVRDFRISNSTIYSSDFVVPTIPLESTQVNTPVDALKKYFQLTTTLQYLRGGYGGNGGFGGGYSGLNGRQTVVGTGGAGRQNLGGFGGGGSGGGLSTSVFGGVGGSILFAELASGTFNNGFTRNGAGGAGTTIFQSNNGVNGSGGTGLGYGYSYQIATVGSGGSCFGGGGGGSGAVGSTSSNLTGASASASQYAGGFIVVISKGSITNSGIIRCNGGAGSNGTAANCEGAGGGGGGGGGAGGGVIALLYGTTYTNTGTVQVNGGAGGTGGTGFGSGEAGGSGTSGSVGTIHIQEL